MNPSDACGVRFQFLDFLSIDLFDFGKAIGQAPIINHFQRRQLFFTRGYDDLATQLILDLFFFTEIYELPITFGAVFGFQTSGFIINTGMDNSAVMSCLVCCQLRTLSPAAKA